MRYIAALTACLLLASNPAYAAEECQWQAADGKQIWTEPGSFSVREDNLNVDHCTLKGNGPGNPIMTAQCEKYDWAFFTVSGQPNGEKDILIFNNEAWYEGCNE